MIITGQLGDVMKESAQIAITLVKSLYPEFADKLKENDLLPSVRAMAKELKISALTVKKAYDNLEQEGFTVTIHGKGTYVAASNKERILEELKREIESDLEKVVQKARGCGLDDSQIREMLELIMED